MIGVWHRRTCLVSKGHVSPFQNPWDTLRSLPSERLVTVRHRRSSICLVAKSLEGSGRLCHSPPNMPKFADFLRVREAAELLGASVSTI